MKKLSVLMLFVGVAAFSFGQKIVNTSGDAKVAFLKGQKAINIEYDYSEMGVGKYKTEESYLEEKAAERNKKEAGSGDKWRDSWVGSRDRVYHPKFEELFNKGMAAKGISGARGMEGAEYTLIVKTTFTEPGFNIGVTKKAASINVEYIFVETANRDNVLAKFVQNGVPGAQAMGMDFDTSTRISESYAKAGKMLAGYLAKQLK